MKRRYFFVFIFLFPFLAKAQVDIFSLQQLHERVLRDNDTVYVVNFWATWCGPCVKEMPHFKSLSKDFNDKPIKFILMSLDAQANIAQVNSFLNKRKIDIETHLFVGGDPNVWINQLEPSWEGSIPATFLYQKGRKLSFKESYFSTKKDLESFVINHR